MGSGGFAGPERVKTISLVKTISYKPPFSSNRIYLRSEKKLAEAIWKI